MCTVQASTMTRTSFSILISSRQMVHFRCGFSSQPSATSWMYVNYSWRQNARPPRVVCVWYVQTTVFGKARCQLWRREEKKNLWNWIVGSELRYEGRHIYRPLSYDLSEIKFPVEKKSKSAVFFLSKKWMNVQYLYEQTSTQKWSISNWHFQTNIRRIYS